MPNDNVSHAVIPFVVKSKPTTKPKPVQAITQRMLMEYQWRVKQASEARAELRTQRELIVGLLQSGVEVEYGFTSAEMQTIIKDGRQVQRLRVW